MVDKKQPNNKPANKQSKNWKNAPDKAKPKATKTEVNQLKSEVAKVRNVTKQYLTGKLNSKRPEDYTIDHFIHSLFDRNGGICRGVAFNTTKTALTNYKASFDITVPTGTYASWYWIPSLVTSANWFRLAYGTGATTIMNPWNPTAIAAVTSQQILGPFQNPNPAIESRIVHADLSIIETNNLLNQGGMHQLAYVPALVNGTNGAATDVIPAFTQNNIDQFTGSRQISGTREVIIQPYPTDDEFYLGRPEALRYYSGIAGTFQNATSASVTLRFTYRVGIEFTPTDAYRFVVDCERSETFITAPYYVAKIADEHFNSLVITTPAELGKALGTGLHSVGKRYVHNAGSASVILSQANANLHPLLQPQRVDVGSEEEKIPGEEPSRHEVPRYDYNRAEVNRLRDEAYLRLHPHERGSPTQQMLPGGITAQDFTQAQSPTRVTGNR